MTLRYEKKPFYSLDFHLVIPCFEESKRLPAYLDSLVAHLEGQPFRCRILIVDDGSRETERQRLREIFQDLKNDRGIFLDPLYLDRNFGKGYAVRSGWSAAKDSKWLAFADADGATPAIEVARVFNMIYQKDDDFICYMGSRIKMLGQSVDRDWKRHILGRIYASLVGVAIQQSVYDSQCGFKIISHRAFRSIHHLLEENRFAFDSELIAALVDSSFKLQEVPVNWRDIAGSKVSLLRDPMKMVLSLLHIQRRRKKWMVTNKAS